MFNELKARAQDVRNYNEARVGEVHTIYYQQSDLKNEPTGNEVEE